MTFIKHYSSSHGNLYEVIANNNARLLVECGVRWKKLQRAINYDLSDIEACLLTHEHKDHSKSVKKVLEHGISVYTALGTWDAMRDVPQPYYNQLCTASGEEIQLPTFTITPFSVRHDAADPLGYRIEADGETLLFATDTRSILEDHGNTKLDIIAIGCSYDKEILQRRVDNCSIDEGLAKRLRLSHPSKQWVQGYLENYCDLSSCREIHLLHCSDGNLNREATVNEFQKYFGVRVL